jgi:hypothetical protein
VQKAGECLPALEHVVHRLRDFVVTRESGAFLAHPVLQFIDQRRTELLTNGETIGSRLAVYIARRTTANASGKAKAGVLP